MNIESLIKSRRSVRSYKPEKVPKSIINRLLEAARWAPSAHNQQPWRFLVVEGKSKSKLLEAIKSRKGREVLLVRIILKHGIKIIENAPVVILVYQHRMLSKRAGFAGRVYFNNADTQEIQGIACAIQNMLLVAHSLGLGAAWLGIPVYCQKQINKAFGVSDKLMGVVTLGYPKEKPRPPSRKPLSKLVVFKK